MERRDHRGRLERALLHDTASSTLPQHPTVIAYADGPEMGRPSNIKHDIVSDHNMVPDRVVEGFGLGGRRHPGP